MTEYSLLLNGIRTTVHEWGYADGAPVILLHTIGLDGSAFRWLAPQLASGARLRILAPDQRGHGLSAAQPDDVRLEAMAQDCIALASTLGPAHLVGQSAGSTVAAIAARRSPASWASVTLAAGPAQGHIAVAARGQAAIDGGMEAVLEDTIMRWFSPTAIARDADYVVYARQRLRANDPQNWAAIWREMARLERVGPIDPVLPSLCIAGDSDQSTPPAAVEDLRIATGIARELVVIEGGTHQLMLESADTVAPALLAFFREVSRGR